MHISREQNEAATAEAVAAAEAAWGALGVTASSVAHSSGHGYAFLRLTVPPAHVVTVAKGLKHDMGVNYCSMITGTHFPDGGAERGWEVVYHLMRQPVRNPEPNTAHVLVASDLKGMDLPLEIEVVVSLPAGDEPTVPSVQSVWKGADWNEKETWDLVGIRFDGHENMHRVLNPHDSPEGFHPLQKQHQIRYHDFNEMYDDAQGFVRKPVDEGRVK
jgi:NADH-quinone oxidoreductase subunit C